MRVGRDRLRPGHSDTLLLRERPMERDSFIFYRSFYEAIRDLPNDIRLEVFTAITEYALYGRLPQDLKPFAKGLFTLIKPNIDVNTARFVNGKKGGRKRTSSSKQPPADDRPAAPPEPGCTLTYEQEVEQMRNDGKWRNTICEDFNISAEEYDRRLSRFLDRCNDDRTRKNKQRHDSYADCQSHLRYWMSKAYPQRQQRQATPMTSSADAVPPNPETYDDGFGALDYDQE